MPTNFITTDTTTSITVNDGDPVIVLPGVNSTSAGNTFDINEESGFFEITHSGFSAAAGDFVNEAFNPLISATVSLAVNVSAGATAIVDDFIAVSALNPNVSSATLTVTNAGFISVSEAVVFAFGFDDVTFVNTGEIVQTGPVSQDLFDSFGDGDARIFNHGTIQSARGAEIVGAFFQAGTTLTLINTGFISSGAETAFDIGGSSAAFAMNNSGTVVGALASDAELELVNSGIFSGAIFSSNSNDEIRNTGTFTESVIMNEGDDKLVTSGDMKEGVFMGAGADTVVNSGEISGNVGMGDGADLFKTAGAGFTTDEVEGGAGNDTLFGGIFDDTMNGGD
ncbi:MAG: hypothetical protein MK160_13370, partial [Rhodobacteraceae bacterium]|nr:hypothetical protein [Paracoccaceae bacterium]